MPSSRMRWWPVGQQCLGQRLIRDWPSSSYTCNGSSSISGSKLSARSQPSALNPRASTMAQPIAGLPRDSRHGSAPAILRIRIARSGWCRGRKVTTRARIPARRQPQPGGFRRAAGFPHHISLPAASGSSNRSGSGRSANDFPPKICGSAAARTAFRPGQRLRDSAEQFDVVAGIAELVVSPRQCSTAACRREAGPTACRTSRTEADRRCSNHRPTAVSTSPEKQLEIRICVGLELAG